MEILLTVFALLFCGASVFSFCKANYCACTKAGECDNPVNRFWLAAIVTTLLALICCCYAFHVQIGTLLWLVLMISCFSGALISAKYLNKKRCGKSAKQASALLTNEPN